jgi:hypothetical protein
VRRVAFTVTIALLGGLVSIPSCASQGEGQRCDVNAANNGSDDCNAGLVCTSNDQLRWPVTTDGGIAQKPATYICCPPPGTAATTDVCKNMMPSIGSDAAIPETGPSETSTSDAPNDSTSDSPDDSPTDTGSDAPTDATGQ